MLRVINNLYIIIKTTLRFQRYSIMYHRTLFNGISPLV